MIQTPWPIRFAERTLPRGKKNALHVMTFMIECKTSKAKGSWMIIQAYCTVQSIHSMAKGSMRAACLQALLGRNIGLSATAGADDPAAEEGEPLDGSAVLSAVSADASSRMHSTASKSSFDNCLAFVFSRFLRRCAFFNSLAKRPLCWT